MKFKFLIFISFIFLTNLSIACGCSKRLKVGDIVFEAELLEIIEIKENSINTIDEDFLHENNIDIKDVVILDIDSDSKIFKFKILNMITGEFDDLIYIKIGAKGSTSCNLRAVPNKLNSTYKLSVNINKFNQGTLTNPAINNYCNLRQALN